MNKYIACYDYENGHNEIWNFAEFKANFIEMLETIRDKDLDPIDDLKDIKAIKNYINDINAIKSIEELRSYFKNYDCFFDWSDWNLSSIRKIGKD